MKHTPTETHTDKNSNEFITVNKLTVQENTTE